MIDADDGMRVGWSTVATCNRLRRTLFSHVVDFLRMMS